MSLISNLWGKYLKNTDERQEGAQNKLDMQKEETLAMIKKAEDYMFSRKCNFSVKDGYCSKDCAHFRHGRIWLFEGDLLFSSRWIESMPRCKLWKEV